MNEIKFCEEALRARADFFKACEANRTNCFRIFAGGEEGIAGFVVEQFARVLFFRRYIGECELSDHDLLALATWYGERLPIDAIYLKDFFADRSRITAPEPTEPIWGSKVPEKFVVEENGRSFWIRPDDGFSVGLFLDQRENRKTLALRGAKKVLNCFAYTAGFSVFCAAQGSSVTSVDISKKYLEWGKENFSLNGIDPTLHRFVAIDTFEYFRLAHKKNERFDLIILDPPSFSRPKKGQVFSVAKQYPMLIEEASALLNPKGALFFSSNYLGWRDGELEKKISSLNLKMKIQALPKLSPDFQFEPSPIQALLLVKK